MTRYAASLGIALMSLGPLAATAQEPEAEAAQDPVAEYETLLRDIRGLELYNALLERQIRAQERKLADVQQAIVDVPDLEVQLPPLLIRMTDSLRTFIDRDTPFFTERRHNVVDSLYRDIENADYSDAFILRRILETWLIEVEFGGNYNTDEGEIEIDGTLRKVDFVIIGRVGLIFQTADDEAITGAWDSRSNSWVILGSEHRNQVRQVVRMARNQIAPDLVLIPTLPPQPD
jgi:hypothetical protein